MRVWLSRIFLFLVLAFIVGNLIVLDYFWFRGAPCQNGTAQAVEKTVNSTVVQENDFCGQRCQETITAKVKEELEKITPLAGQSSVSPPMVAPRVSQPTTIPQAKVIYIPLASSGSAASVDWTKVSGSEFYFDLTSYAGVKEVRFEAQLKALHGSAKVYGRLYDSTNHRGVDYSDLQTQSADFVRLESSPLSIWRGNNKYEVQLRSVNGMEAQIKDARLKIIF
jgi:hypothetical protein